MLNTTRFAGRVREDFLESLVAYAKKGRPVGHFLTAVLANDLTGAMGRADDTARRQLFDICDFVYNELPSGCWGTREKVAAWTRIGGLESPLVDEMDAPTLEEEWETA